MSQPKATPDDIPAAASIKMFVIALVVVLGAYFTRFAFDTTACLSPAAEPWGQFGDYVGGIMNPIVAGLALLWLMRSVRLQEKELRETRQALSESAKSQADQVRIGSLNAILVGHNAEILSVQETLNRQSVEANNLGRVVTEDGKSLEGPAVAGHLRNLQDRLATLREERTAIVAKLKELI